MSTHTGGTKPHHPYQILSQEHGEELTHDGRFVPSMTVRFRHADTRHIGSVKVPMEEYNAGHVDRQIQHHLDHVHDVATLGGEPHPENRA